MTSQETQMEVDTGVPDGPGKPSAPPSSNRDRDYSSPHQVEDRDRLTGGEVDGRERTDARKLYDDTAHKQGQTDPSSRYRYPDAVADAGGEAGGR